MTLWFEELKKKKATRTHNSKGEKKDRCAKLADKKYGMKSSAYKSGFIVQCRNGKVAKAESKYNLENLSEKKRELFESEPSFDVGFPEYDHPDNEKEIKQVLSLRENNPIDKDKIEDLDQNNNETMLNIVGESKKDRIQLIKDIDIHTIKLKVKYGRPRPYEITDKIDSITDTDDSPSFPSGHATEAHALAKILAEEYPDKKEELEKMAEKISLSRVQMGSHYPSDIEVGKKVGLLIADAYLNKDMKKSWQDILVKDWVSCSSCTDDKEGTEPCGRKDASKGTKRRCRPTCSACKDYKRRAGKKGKRKKRKAGTFSREEDKGLHGWFERRG